MKRIRRTVALLATAGLAAAGMIGLGQPASANHISCGATITQSVTLDSNLLNCPGDGLRVTGSNIVIDLAGRTISGRTDTNTSPNEFVGIRLMNVTNVTVRNGTVTNFDAGVGIGRGGGNTIIGLNLTRNINHSTLTGALNPCDFGDGLVTFSSDNNVIRNNRLSHNGPYGGISLVDDSDGNLITGNISALHDVDNAHPAFVTPDRPAGNGPCGPFVTGIGDVGAPTQGIGIRIEGPGADNNTVEGNHVIDNDVYGITIHGYVCSPMPNTPQPDQVNNGGNVIIRNNVTRNGFQGAPPASPPGQGRGIAQLQQGPANVVCVAHSNSILQNVVTGNAGHGIWQGGRASHSNRINGNIVRNNGVDGIRVEGPTANVPPPGCGDPARIPCPGAINNELIGNIGFGNDEHDGHDANPGCDNNRWRRNTFQTVFQGCERHGGGGA